MLGQCVESGHGIAARQASALCKIEIAKPTASPGNQQRKEQTQPDFDGLSQRVVGNSNGFHAIYKLAAAYRAVCDCGHQNKSAALVIWAAECFSVSALTVDAVPQSAPPDEGQIPSAHFPAEPIGAGQHLAEESEIAARSLDPERLPVWERSLAGKKVRIAGLPRAEECFSGSELRRVSRRLLNHFQDEECSAGEEPPPDCCLGEG